MDGNDFRNKGHPMGLPRNKPKKSEESRSPKNFRSTGSDFKVGGGQRCPSTSVEKAPTDSGTEKEVICFQCQKPGHFQAGYRCKAEGYTVRNCPN